MARTKTATPEENAILKETAAPEERGVEVEVPACVAEVIRNSDRQKQLAEQRLEKLVEQYIKER